MGCQVLDLSFNDLRGANLGPLGTCKTLQVRLGCPTRCPIPKTPSDESHVGLGLGAGVQQLYLGGNRLQSLENLPRLPNLEVPHFISPLSPPPPCSQLLLASPGRSSCRWLRTSCRTCPWLPNPSCRYASSPSLSVQALETEGRVWGHRSL